jgi:hypothetical protein
MSNFIKAFPLKKKFLHTLAPYSILLKNPNCCHDYKMEYSAYRIFLLTRRKAATNVCQSNTKAFIELSS